jgi:hypothetical protein
MIPLSFSSYQLLADFITTYDSSREVLFSSSQRHILKFDEVVMFAIRQLGRIDCIDA